MRLFAPGKVFLSALLIAVSLPCVAFAIGPKPPVQDVVFDSAFAIDGSLSNTVIRRFRANGTTTQTFPDVELEVDVTGGVITFQPFTLDNGDTTIDIQIAPVNLVQTRTGSTFRTGGLATVDDGVEPFNIGILVKGRILQSGNYVLTGNILGTRATNQGGGNAVVDVLRVGLTGTTPIPTP